MRSYQPSSDRRRATSLALTIAAHLLIVFLLLRLAPVFDPPKEPGRSLTVNMLPVGDNQSTATKSAKAPARAANASRRPAPEPPAAPRPPTQETPVTPPVDTPFPGYLMLSRKDYAATDVGKIPSNRSGGSAGKQLASAEGQGDGDPMPSPAGKTGNGESFYNGYVYSGFAASQLGPYVPANAPNGSWGELLCRMAEHDRVTDCVQLGDSRPGLGIARGLRQAAWQFRVRPPTSNGKLWVGKLLRIHIDIARQDDK